MCSRVFVDFPTGKLARRYMWFFSLNIKDRWILNVYIIPSILKSEFLFNYCVYNIEIKWILRISNYITIFWIKINSFLKSKKTVGINVDLHFRLSNKLIFPIVLLQTFSLLYSIYISIFEKIVTNCLIDSEIYINNYISIYEIYRFSFRFFKCVRFFLSTALKKYLNFPDKISIC